VRAERAHFQGDAWAGLAHYARAEASLAEAAGDHAGARAALDAALRDLLGRADRIGDPALRRSFLEEVPENARTLALA